MADAKTPLESQATVDRMALDVAKKLGKHGGRRYDLEGNVLTEKEQRELPVNLGLHHHGALPEKAGYSLIDVLVLARSSVGGQRAAALGILGAVVEKGGKPVLDMLGKCGGVGFAFGKEGEGKRGARAYVDALEKVADVSADVDKEGGAVDLYFASAFYGVAVRGNRPSVIDDLVKSGSRRILANIITANIDVADMRDVVQKCLRLMAIMMRCNKKAARDLVSAADAVDALHRAARSNDDACEHIAMMACEVLAYAVVQVGWDDADALDIVKERILTEAFLTSMAVHLAWFSSEEQLRGRDAVEKIHNAIGALRVFRAALAFGICLQVFSGVVQSVCVLADMDGIDVEAYLTLEAYAHSLYVYAKGEDDKDRHSFAVDQLRGLVPLALRASRTFGIVASDEELKKKAGLGHFAATVMQAFSMGVAKDVQVGAVNMARKVNGKIVDMTLGVERDLNFLQVLASVSQAAARMVASVELLGACAEPAMMEMMKGVVFEERVRGVGCTVWRPVINAMVEWVACLAKVGSGCDVVKKAFWLLPRLSDVQVVLDLLSRCVLNVPVLKKISPSIKEEDAKECVQSLLPITLTVVPSLLQPTSSSDLGSNTDEDIRPLSMERLMGMWAQHSELRNSVHILSKALIDRDGVACNTVFCSLLHWPSDTMENIAHIELLMESAKKSLKVNSVLLKQTNTRLAALSTAANPVIADGILHLGDMLVSRGPVPQDVHGEVDSLSSLVLTVMCITESDVTLRESLWRKTIIECGGGLLFQNGVYLPHELDVTDETEEEDELLALFCAAIADGLLMGERCPRALRLVIMERLDKRLRVDREAEVLNVLRAALRGSNHTMVLALREEIMSCDGQDLSCLSQWMEEQVNYRKKASVHKC